MTRCTELVAIGISCGKQIPCPDHDAPTTAAQPQAPAEPTEEQIDKAGRVLAAIMDAERRGENMDPIIARALAAEAAPLREERDRLAGDAAKGRLCEVEQHTSRIHYGTEDNERLRAELAAERAKVAERDARIATLTKAARSAANGLAEWKLWMNSPRNAPAETMRQYAQAMQETERDLRAALGAPEGQPPQMVVCKNMTDAYDGRHPLDPLLCVEPTPAPLDALRGARKALDSLWAAIGDRLLGKGPLAKEYANGVAREVKYAIADIDAVLSTPPRKAPQEGPMAHFAALADQDCEHGMEAIGETCSAESASREEGNEEDYPFQYWCGPCIAKAVGFKPSPVRIQRARVLAESAPSSPEEQLSGKELK